MGEVSFTKKIGICCMLMFFGLAVLGLHFGMTSGYGSEMSELSARGIQVTAHRTALNRKVDGLQRPYNESVYEYEVDGQTYRHMENSYPQWDDDPPKDVEVLAYFPESPGVAKAGVPKWEKGRRVTPLIASGFLLVGAAFLIVTLARRGVNAQAEAADWAAADDRHPDVQEREFTYRRPLVLITALILIPVCVFMPAAFAMGASRGEIKVNGRVGDPAAQWGAFGFVALVCGIFIVLAVIMLLSYKNERIVWENGYITWYDRMGNLNVRSPISEIMEVDRSRNWFGGSRRQPVDKITISTLEGDIVFLDSIPWAPILESWAKAAARENNQSRPQIR